MTNNHKIYTPNKIFKNKKWSQLQTKEDYFEHFAQQNCSFFKYYKQLKISYERLAFEKYKRITKELDITKESPRIDFGVEINSYIEQIKNAKLTEEGIRNNVTSDISTEQGIALLDKWYSLLSLIKRNQWDSLEKEIQNIRNYAENLQKAIDNNSALNLSSIVGSEKDTMKSALAVIEGTLSRIQGEVLEQEALRFIMKNLPDDIDTAKTGSIKFGGKSIKSDLIAIDIQNKDKEVIFKVENGDLKFTGNEEKIVTLTTPDLKSLNEQTVGFSAKTSQGQITFHRGYNINQLLLDSLGAGYGKAAVYQLYHLYQLGFPNVSNSFADPYQRYAVARIASRIIGENNAFLITAKGIEPTYVYLDQIMNQGLSFSNREIKALSERGKGYNSDFGTTDIIGPTHK